MNGAMKVSGPETVKELMSFLLRMNILVYVAYIKVLEWDATLLEPGQQLHQIMELKRDYTKLMKVKWFGKNALSKRIKYEWKNSRKNKRMITKRETDFRVMSWDTQGLFKRWFERTVKGNSKTRKNWNLWSILLYCWNCTKMNSLVYNWRDWLHTILWIYK